MPLNYPVKLWILNLEMAGAAANLNFGTREHELIEIEYDFDFFYGTTYIRK